MTSDFYACRKGAQRTLLLGLCLLAASALAGCAKSGIAGELARMKETGHTPSEFIDMEAGILGATRCQSGTVDTLEVMLCEYTGSEGAALGYSAAERWLNRSAHGIVLRRGPLLFTAADRDHTDPNGKVIASLAQTFRRASSR